METDALMFGRNQEMDTISEALARAAAGSGGLLLIPGDAGIGKTRLVEQASSVASGLGALSLWGRCRSAASAPPFWPWAQVAREARRAIDRHRLAKLTDGADPAIGSVFPELRHPEAAPSGGNDYEEGPAQARFKSLDAAADWIAGISDIQPCLLVIEDLHWADQASLDLLEFVTERAADRGLLIAATYRESELPEDHPLLKTVQSLLRLPAVQRIPLSGISIDQSRRLIGYNSSYSLPEETVKAIAEQSEGNPFFIREMVNDVVDSGTGELPRLPETVREAIWRRLGRLDEKTIEVLTVAAVYGKPVTEEDLVGTLPGLDDSEVLESLELAVRAREFREIAGTPKHYDFVHALIARTLLESVGVPTLRAIHARIGAYLEQLDGQSSGDQVTQAAHHYLEAGSAVDPVTAARMAISAGERLLNAHAYTDAVPWFEAALERFSHTEAESLLIAKAHAGLGRALGPSTFDVPGQQQAWNHLSSAFGLLVSEGEIEEALVLAGTELAFRSLTGTADVLEKAVQLGKHSNKYGWLLSRYAIAQLDDRKDLKGMLETLRLASSVAEESGNLHLKAFIELRIAQGLSRAGRVREGISYGRNADRLADSLDIPSITARQMGWIGLDTLLIGLPNESQAIVDKGLAVAEHLNDNKWLYWGFKSQLKRHIFCGDWSSATSTILKLSDLTESSSEIGWFRSYIDCETGCSRPSAVIADLPFDSVPDEPYDRTVTTLAVRVLDQCRLEESRGRDINNRAEQVQQAIAKLPVRYPEAIDVHFMNQALLDMLIGDIESCERRYAKILNCETRIELGTGSTNRLAGRIAAYLGNVDEAFTQFRLAKAFCANAGYWPEYGYTCLDLGSLMHSHHLEPGHTLQVLDEGIETAIRLSMKLLLNRLRDLRSLVTAPVNPIRQFELTERQSEVLQLIAQGMTNQQIASSLEISPNTVARHVANIYMKLGSGNRVTLATRAAQLGLV